MTKVSQLNKPTGLRDTCYRFGSQENGHESEYYPSFQSLLSSAKALGNISPAAPYQDAYHLLNFSIECFMKYVFCVIREDQWSKNDPENVASSIPLLYRRAFSQKTEKFSAGSYGHDVVLLMDDILAATQDLNKIDFMSLKKELATDRSSWVADRYKLRQHSKYKLKFERRLRKFEDVLAGTLARFI